MHNQAAQAYQQVAKKTIGPRDLEANLLSKAAAQMLHIRNNWEAERTGLTQALIYNRKLWNILLTSVTREDNPLPIEIKQNVANLGLFVMNHSLKIQANPAAQKLDVLININKELAAGLRQAPQAA